MLTPLQSGDLRCKRGWMLGTESHSTEYGRQLTSVQRPAGMP